MSAYPVDPANPLSPTDQQGAKQGAEEFRALKAYLATLAGLGGASNLLQARNLFGNPNWNLDQINEGALYTVTGGGANIQGPDFWTGRAVAAPGIFKLRKIVNPDRANENCLEITCTTIDAAIAAGDCYDIFTAIEGYDIADLGAGTVGAKSIVINIPIKFSKAGNYGLAIRNSATNRSYVTTVTQLVANTWETKSITILLDTAGVWLYNNGVGLYVSFCLAAGATFQAAPDAWTAGDFRTIATQVNFMDNVANIGYIGRIQCIAGAINLPVAPPDIQKELTKAQRYYEKSYEQGTIIATATSTGSVWSGWASSGAGAYFVRGHAFFKVTKRAIPAIPIWDQAGNANACFLNAANGKAAAVVDACTAGFAVDGTTGGGATDLRIAFHYAANARLS